MRKSRIIIILMFLYVIPVWGTTIEDVISVLNIVDFFIGYSEPESNNISEPLGIDCFYEELRSGQVEIIFANPENNEICFTTDGRPATTSSPRYKSPIIVDIGTEIHWCIVSQDDEELASNSFSIERNNNPKLLIENNAQFGTLITFEDDKWLNDLPVCYAIIPENEFHAGSSQYDMKILFDWQEYLSPIILSDISYDDFVIAYVIPTTDGKLSSDVQYQVFHKVNGSCFNYVFYDKGEYSEGWRYIEICPIEQEGSYGAKGVATSATNSGLGQGLENTKKIVSSDADISDNYAAQKALNLVYVNKDDWYLPSIDELKEANEIYPELFSLFSDYWSSTEKDADKAYTLRWSRDKDSELKYYVVRRF